MPFTQAVMRSHGSVGPCCINYTLGNLKKENLLQYWNSEKLQNFRNKIIEDSHEVSGCETCYSDEKLYGTSMRLDALKNYKFTNSATFQQTFESLNYKELKFPKLVELHVSNLCNLKCLTCDPRDSSKFLSENKILKISDENQEDFELDQETLLQNLNLVFTHAETIDLRGGESLLVPQIKKFLLDIDESVVKDKKLKIQTNGSIIDADWIKIFKKFQSLEIMLSLDAIDKDIEYIRFPVNWSQLVKNIQEFKKLDCKLYVNCTVSNLNILLIDKLIDWCAVNNLELNLVFLSAPYYFRIENLPQVLLDSATAKLKPYYQQYPSLRTTMENNKSNMSQWEKFCDMIDKRDSYRKNSIFTILPEYKNYWHKH